MTERHGKDSETLELRARISTLEQLLDVYERSVMEQSDRLYEEQERIRFQKTLLESQGEASLDGILSVGVDGTILFANRRLSEMWGMSPPAVGTKSIDRVLRAIGERSGDSEGFLERSSGDEDGEESRREISLSDGRTFEQYTAPIRSREGKNLGRVWQFRDISAFKEIDRVKDEFISAVSHELRTPLTSIRGSMDLMAGGVMGELPSEAMALLKVGQKNCDRLVRIINDVLDIQKIEAGRMEFSFGVIALEDVMAESVAAIQPYGERLGVALQLESSAPGVRVRADPDRLMQVMDNLLSNAAKFSPAGGTVEVKLASRGHFARVRVEDRGPGIAPDFQGRVFEKFSQGSAQPPRDRTGSGLGLNIARAIVERMQGSIGFRPRPGGGTVFYFDLPVWRDSQHAEPAR
ncbi:MAG: PAS domain S-box protein [Myxococcales bacterium]|jgi:PAS domain S-box-containing protein|nr:MAG: PAS domain S-box protein [Myxococcales bacterium]